MCYLWKVQNTKVQDGECDRLYVMLNTSASKLLLYTASIGRNRGEQVKLCNYLGNMIV
jgi:hypothetical protein